MSRMYLGTGYTFDSLLSVADTASDLTSLSITNTGANGVSIDLTGNGSTTPSKFLRVTSGQFQIINSAYTSVILAVTDLGVLSAGGITSTPISGSTGSFTTLSASGAAAFTSTLNVTGFTTLGSGNIGPGGSYFGSNTIYSSGWKYVGTDFAWFMRSDGTTSDVVSLNVAPSGTAGAAMTFVQAMSVSQTGAVTLPVSLTVSGAAAFTSLSASGTVSGAGITSLLAPYALLSGATFSGNISAPSIFTAGASIGLVGLYTGGASNTGYVAFYDPSGTRQGYVGYATSGGYLSLESENGNLGYNVTGQLVVNGLTTANGGLYVAAGFSGTLTGSQGAYVTWNASGGGGETDFINNHGGGAGGFYWYNCVAAGALSTLTQLATLNSLGAFSAVSVVGLGNGGGTSSAFLAQKSGSVGYGWDDTSQGTDAKVWDALAVSGTMLFRTVNDTNSAATTWLSVTRSGYAPQVITLTAPTITLAGAVYASSYVGVGSSAFASDVHLDLGTAAGHYRTVRLLTASGVRWEFGADTTSEAGSNAGSNFFINTSTDAGAYLATPFQITRASGLVSINYGAAIGGSAAFGTGVTFGNQVGANNTDCSKHIALYSATSTPYGFNVTASSLNYTAPTGAAHYFNISGTNVLEVSGGTGLLTVTGWITVSGGINIGGAGTYYSSNLTYSSGWKYIASDYGAMLYFGGSSGTSLYVAPTGTAGATAAIVQAWNVTPAGAMTVYGPLTCAGTISAGTATFTGGLFVSGGTWAPGMLYSDGNWGMLIRGQTRTVDADLALCNGAGNVSLGIMASGLTTINTGLSFNSQSGANNTDCSKHIALWGTTFGFNVTASALNYTVSTGSAHYFNINGTNALTVANGSTTVTGNLTVTGTISGVTGSTTSVSTIAALRLLASGANAVYVQGYSAAGDGGGGFFNLGASGTDNAATIIVSANGTYYRDIGTGPISLLAFGATGNGTTDDAAAFNRVTTILTHGGAVTLPAGHAFTVLSAVTIGAGISICGPYENAGEFALSHTGSPAWLPSSAYTASQTAVNNSNIYRVTTAGTSASSGGPSGTGTGITDGTVVWSYVQPQASFWTTYCTLTISSAVTVTLDSSTTITGCLIYRAGMTFPITTAAAFAGNAFTFNGDNVCIRNSIIMGFQYAIASTGCDRGVIENVCFDNLNNIYASGAGDTWRIHFCHAWPFAADATAMASLTRAGSNIFISNCNDAAIVRDCFEYGYLNGFVANNAGAVSFIRCGADGTSPPYSGSSGFLIQGSATSTTGALNAQVVDCQAYLQTAAVNVPLGGTVMSTVKITGCTMGGCTDGIYIPASSASLVQVYNNDIGAGTGIVYSAATVLMDIDNNNFSGCGTIINATVATENIHIGQGNRGGYIGGTTDGLSLAPGSNLVLFTITPAGSIAALPPVGDVFGVAAGNFGTLAGGHTGRRVTLLFLGASAVYSSSGSSAMFLNGNVTFNAIAYSTLTLVYTGSQWFEVSRMVA